MERLEFFTITGEDGNEYNFMFLEELKINNQRYWICYEAFKEEDSEDIVLGDTVAFKVNSEKGELFLDAVEDDEELELVEEEWKKVMEDVDIDENEEFFLIEDDDSKDNN
ncbi:hypothetical protein XO10_05435 [Marinitoga sp. 1135]|uniref:DUF1292 domain-containing protein n=1 Tax=Marinitoga piezophila (strain DSM 14283 / JCM 11233 / KA3) TaxID=443254 RepID=H2J818_MARPK|nr:MULTISPECIES: DUF1292 domain-containing protein [Marinitoga]AEX85509.1 Protein of unknown function (DUF1292) [Marinitoga piezophila KA3]NUU95718.1 hypothetical protein [Marinitoga sp. 1135]NUU97650.1 hypothetical protein [Marinitoga sp. 1138]